MTDQQTQGTEVATTQGTEAATLNPRLAKLMAKEQQVTPPTVFELINKYTGEGEDAFSDEFLPVAQAFLSKVGVWAEFLQSQGVNAESNIEEWQPTIAAIRSGKEKNAAELQHIPINSLYNYGTKAVIDLSQKFYPVFIHGEELLRDDSGSNIEDRVKVPYNSAQEAKTPGYDYQNIVYLVNEGFTEVFMISVKSAGHKYATNILRNYMYPNYKNGAMFNPSLLKNWMSVDVVSHTSKKSGYTNPYVRLQVSDDAVTSDQARLLQIIQRNSLDDFKKVIEARKAEAAEEAETQALVDDNTSTDDSGDSFTQL